MPRTKAHNAIPDVIAQLVADFPGEQSRDLARKAVGEVTPETLRAYAVVKIEQDISKARRRLARALERESRLSKAKPGSRPTTAELRSRAADLLDVYKAQLHVDWTAALRASTFALGDGTSVAWGKATIEQHETRIDMLTVNARGNLDGIRVHEAAIRALTESGTATLNDMVRKVST